ncbi:unnamed protein product [Cyclocybe aegerita]|uniref:EF-hand domain-containing protein n=1 Tax=Cyclocybe aegerita TaxID=1973307 RepID=A0A8S0WG08_CYCAE|nr:unnamed protein product [Cyclocybe aegerita]
MSSSESLFFTLPKQIRRAIDGAFDATIKPNQVSKANRRTPTSTNTATSSGGGFLVEEPASGSFLVEDDNEDDSDAGDELAQIPLELIPAALQRLDLPPDDDEVLAVFKNAASGWTSSSIRPSQGDNPHEETYVSRSDWRSVCAVLLENNPEEDDAERGVPMDEDEDDGASDEYVEEKSSPVEDLSGEASSDEYMDGPGKASSSKRQTRARKRAWISSPIADSSVDNLQKLTSRRRQTCLATFALFFEGVSSEELMIQKIMIKDLQRVTKLLNEKLKADEMIEMLEMFSTSPDKSMSFDDFCRMMTTARLA